MNSDSAQNTATGTKSAEDIFKEIENNYGTTYAQVGKDMSIYLDKAPLK